MAEVPVIVVSSPFPRCGKTTLALNLAAALWSDDYRVELFAPENELAERFLKQRKKLQESKKLQLFMPELINDIPEEKSHEKQVIVAIIPAENAVKYADAFNKAHTLITVVPFVLDTFWNAANDYVNLIWNAKKHIASRGIKTANWVVVPYIEKSNASNVRDGLTETAKRYGFRVADVLPYRDAYNHVKDGYCAADMKRNNASFPMAFADVYARHEILKLTDFFWKQNI